MPKMLDLAGQTFGRLTAIKRSERSSHWVCKCVCGKVSVVRGADLKNGNTKSCGCLQKEMSAKSNKKHGGRRTRLYRIWIGMKYRCYSPNSPKYSIYGGRGITVCEDWKNDFATFREWAKANGYNDSLSIDRIDSNKGYEPGNCRWGTQKEQQNNKRNNHVIACNGEKHTLTEWARIKGIPRRTLQHRIGKGLTGEELFAKNTK